MGHCYHHALSSVKKWGGVAEDYLPLHQWFDVIWTSKPFFAHFAGGGGRPSSHKNRPIVGKPPGKEPAGSSGGADAAR